MSTLTTVGLTAGRECPGLLSTSVPKFLSFIEPCIDVGINLQTSRSLNSIFERIRAYAATIVIIISVLSELVHSQSISAEP